MLHCILYIADEQLEDNSKDALEESSEKAKQSIEGGAHGVTESTQPGGVDAAKSSDGGDSSALEGSVINGTDQNHETSHFNSEASFQGTSDGSGSVKVVQVAGFIFCYQAR